MQRKDREPVNTAVSHKVLDKSKKILGVYGLTVQDYVRHILKSSAEQPGFAEKIIHAYEKQR